MLEATQVRKSYGETVALDGVDLSVRAGQVVALLGPNGAGKTTFVRIVAGLLRPDSGTVSIDGHDAVGARRQVNHLVGLASQDLAFYPILTVAQNLRFFARLGGLPATQVETRIEEVADALDLLPFLGRLAYRLSGGEKRRVHTAIALVHRPPLLLLDEPTAGADVTTRGRILDVVRQLAADGAAVCYSTHYFPEVEELDAHVVILDRGRVVSTGTVSDLVGRHGAAFVVLDFEDAPGEATRIACKDPSVELPLILDGLGDRRSQVRSIELVKPNLESVFVSLTGRPIDEDASSTAAA